jgi:hypothetical protein
MRSTLLFAMLLTLTLSPTVAMSQGYYRNTLRRNPYTGRWEVMPTGQVGQSAFGPYRNQRSFSAQTYDPASGTLSRSAVQRNPFTGRLEVQNEYYNPYTGARMTQGTRFNPLTGRYETANSYAPPTNPIPRTPAASPPVVTEVVPPNTPPSGAIVAPAGEALPDTGAAAGTVPPYGAPASPDGTTPRRTTTGKPIVRPKIIETFPTDAPPPQFGD